MRPVRVVVRLRLEEFEGVEIVIGAVVLSASGTAKARSSGSSACPASLSATAQTTAKGIAALPCSASLSASALAYTGGRSEIQVSATVTAWGAEIPTASRTYWVEAESRSYAVAAEVRELEVSAESRTLVVIDQRVEGCLMATSWMKDPDATLEYTVDWNAWLAGDTISTVTWTIAPSGTGCVSKSSQSNTTTTATAWLTGGTAGKEYSVACRIVTGGGRTDERTFTIKVVNR